MVRYWAVRIGGASKYVEAAEENHFIALGWNELGNLSWLFDSDEEEGVLWEKLKEQMELAWEGSPAQIRAWSAAVWPFVYELERDDIVLVPDTPNDRVLIGRVDGPYEFVENPGDECPFSHRRRVDWLKTVERSDLSQRLKRSLNAHITMFRLDKHEVAIQELLGKKRKVRVVRTVSGDELEKVIIGKLLNLEPREFEEFIRDLLTAGGFEAVTTPYVADRGVDIIASFAAEGLVELKLLIQTKCTKASVGGPVVRQLRGALEEGENGVIITTSKFSKQALEEAEKKSISLVDGRGLVELILRYYDNLADHYRDMLNLEHRDMPLKELFSVKTSRR